MRDLSNENVIHIKKGKIEYLQFRKLLEYPEITHAYSLGTNLDFRTNKNEEKAIKNYKMLCEELHVEVKNLVKPNQAHTDCVKKVSEKQNKNMPDFNLSYYDETDGLVTNKKEIMLATTNADCILMLFYDPVKKVISNIHSGWRGTLQRISINAVEKMIVEYKSNPKDIICCICPSIRKCHFEVEKDVKDLFEKEFQDLKELDKIIEEKIPNKKWNIDTVLINQIILQEKGLKKENIIDSGICSVCNSDIIHSYRVEKQGYGLSTACIQLN